MLVYNSHPGHTRTYLSVLKLLTLLTDSTLSGNIFRSLTVLFTKK